MKASTFAAGSLALIALAAAPAIAGPHGQPPHAPKPPAAKPASAKPTTTTTTTTTTSGAPTSSPTTTTTSPIATKIASHPQLAAKVTALLPKDMTLDQAATGFKNQGQLIAALHVSKNLNIPFAKLKADMTGPNHDSLGQAIHDLKPGVDATTAAKHATAQADADVKQ